MILIPSPADCAFHTVLQRNNYSQFPYQNTGYPINNPLRLSYGNPVLEIDKRSIPSTKSSKLSRILKTLGIIILIAASVMGIKYMLSEEPEDPEVDPKKHPKEKKKKEKPVQEEKTPEQIKEMMYHECQKLCSLLGITGGTTEELDSIAQRLLAEWMMPQIEEAKKKVEDTDMDSTLSRGETNKVIELRNRYLTEMRNIQEYTKSDAFVVGKEILYESLVIIEKECVVDMPELARLLLSIRGIDAVDDIDVNELLKPLKDVMGILTPDKRKKAELFLKVTSDLLPVIIQSNNEIVINIGPLFARLDWISSSDRTVLAFAEAEAE